MLEGIGFLRGERRHRGAIFGKERGNAIGADGVSLRQGAYALPPPLPSREGARSVAIDLIDPIHSKKRRNASATVKMAVILAKAGVTA